MPARTAQLLEQAGLSGWVEPVLAPSDGAQARRPRFDWYGLDPLLRTLNDKIDFLFVDGPPGKMQSLSRYPALPVLAPHLAPRAFVFVDDGARDDELQMIELWRELEDVAFESETLDFLPHAPVLLTMATEREPRRGAAPRDARSRPTRSPTRTWKLFGAGAAERRVVAAPSRARGEDPGLFAQTVANC